MFLPSIALAKPANVSVYPLFCLIKAEPTNKTLRFVSSSFGVTSSYDLPQVKQL